MHDSWPALSGSHPAAGEGKDRESSAAAKVSATRLHHACRIFYVHGALMTDPAGHSRNGAQLALPAAAAAAAHAAQVHHPASGDHLQVLRMQSFIPHILQPQWSCNM